MAIYTGEVIDNAGDFPFLAIVTDDTGKVVGEFPVRTKADGEAKIMETLRGFEEQATLEANEKVAAPT